MGWSKRQLVEAAFEELGMAGYVFNLQPEQLQIAVRRLDAMMAQWSALGIRVSYPISDNPKSVRIEDVTHVPDFALEAIFFRFRRSGCRFPNRSCRYASGRCRIANRCSCL